MVKFKKIMIFFGFLVAPFCAEGATLHAIMACDVLGVEIGPSVVEDLRMMKEEVRRISEYTGLDLREYTITADVLIPKNLYETTEAIDVKEKDVVIFYFSGHGFRTTLKDSNPWPYLYLTPARRAIDFDKIVRMLKEKHPRFLLAIADCCNNYLPEKYAPEVEHRAYEPKGILHKRYRELFLKGPEHVCVSSSSIGEYAWCYSRGALFTLAFMKTLRKLTKSEDKITWEVVLDQTSQEVIEYQRPYYEIAE